MDNLFGFLPNEINVSDLTFKFTRTDITQSIAGLTIHLPSAFKNRHIITLLSIEGTAGYPQLHCYRYTNTSYSISVPQLVGGGTLTIYGCSIGY